MKQTEAQKRASKNYYLRHYEEFKERVKQNAKKIRRERREYKARIDQAIEYIQNESWFCFKDNEEVIDRTPVEKLIEILRGVSNDG